MLDIAGVFVLELLIASIFRASSRKVSVDLILCLQTLFKVFSVMPLFCFCWLMHCRSAHRSDRSFLSFGALEQNFRLNQSIEYLQTSLG